MVERVYVLIWPDLQVGIYKCKYGSARFAKISLRFFKSMVSDFPLQRYTLCVRRHSIDASLSRTAAMKIIIY